MKPKQLKPGSTDGRPLLYDEPMKVIALRLPESLYKAFSSLKPADRRAAIERGLSES